MTRKDLQIRVMRNKISHDYKIDKSNNNFDNNIKNNSKDVIIIAQNNSVIFKAFCQSISNHPDYSYKDTIKQGNFQVKCFVDARSFHGEIHGLINGVDLENQEIDAYSMQLDNGYQKGRWLIHDRFSFAKKRDLHNAYSGGCFILSSESLDSFNGVLKKFDVKPGDVIPGILWEV